MRRSGVPAVARSKNSPILQRRGPCHVAEVSNFCRLGGDEEAGCCRLLARTRMPFRPRAVLEAKLGSIDVIRERRATPFKLSVSELVTLQNPIGGKQKPDLPLQSDSLCQDSPERRKTAERTKALESGSSCAASHNRRSELETASKDSGLSE